MEKFYIILAAARANTKMNQKQFAKALGVSEATIKNWERGKTSPKSEHLRKISQLTGVPMDYIFLPETLLKVEKRRQSNEATRSNKEEYR